MDKIIVKDLVKIFGDHPEKAVKLLKKVAPRMKYWKRSIRL